MPTFPRPASLRPDERLAFACAARNRTALALAECWKFNQPVTIMSDEELDALSERCHVTFTGRSHD